MSVGRVPSFACPGALGEECPAAQKVGRKAHLLGTSRSTDLIDRDGSPRERRPVCGDWQPAFCRSADSITFTCDPFFRLYRRGPATQRSVAATATLFPGV